jgi:cardiolipin synthase
VAVKTFDSQMATRFNNIVSMNNINMSENAFSIESIFTEGDTYSSALFEALERAKTSVEFEVYIFENCIFGNQILNQLKDCVLRGVEVFLMVDGIGSFNDLSWLQQKCLNFNIKFKIFNPFNSWRRLFSLNKRNHRKMISIDGSVIFIGSINVSKVHFTSEIKKPWKDLALKSSGKSVKVMQSVFYKNWNLGLAPKTLRVALPLEITSSSLLKNLKGLPWRINDYLILRFYFWRDLLKRLRQAKHRIWIMNAYFVPHRTLLRSLVKAAKNGADVSIVVPGQSDVPITKWVAPVFYRYLLKNKIKIFEYSESMLHTKTLLIDGWGVVGSHNLNYRSLVHDLEVEVAVEDPNYIRKMENYYLQIMSKSRVVPLSEVENLSWWRWLRCRIILLFKYYI